MAAAPLKFVAFNCLKGADAKEVSSTEVLLTQLIGEFQKHGARGDVIRAVDHNIKPRAV